MAEYRNQIFLGGTVAVVVAISIVAGVLYLPSGVSQSRSTSTNNFCSNPCIILIKNDVYGNGLPVSVAVGTIVIWINEGAGDNTVTSTCGIFNSPLLSDGQNFSYTFNQAGGYYYIDQIHPASSWVFVGGTGAQNVCSTSESYSNNTSVSTMSP